MRHDRDRDHPGDEKISSRRQSNQSLPLDIFKFHRQQYSYFCWGSILKGNYCCEEAKKLLLRWVLLTVYYRLHSLQRTMRGVWICACIAFVLDTGTWSCSAQGIFSSSSVFHKILSRPGSGWKGGKKRPICPPPIHTICRFLYNFIWVDNSILKSKDNFRNFSSCSLTWQIGPLSGWSYGLPKL